MGRAGRLRLIGLLAVLIASTIQGLTPDAHSVVSPWTLEWLQVPAAANGSDARFGRMPEKDRPSSPDESDRDGTTAEVGLPGEPGAQAVMRQRLAHTQGHPFASIDVCNPSDALGARRCERPRDPSESVTDLTISLGRLTC